MNAQHLQELVRDSLTERAPASAPPAPGWEPLQRAAYRHRGLRRVRQGALGAGLVAALVVAVPLVSGVSGGDGDQRIVPAAPSVVQADGTVEAEAVDAAIAADRGDQPAPRTVIEDALQALMAEPSIIDRSAPPRVLWSGAGPEERSASEGPYALVGVEQGDAGWVLGYWHEHQPDSRQEPTRTLTWTGTAPAGDIDDQLVLVRFDDDAYPDISGLHFAFLAPEGAAQVDITSGDDAVPDPLGTFGPFSNLIVQQQDWVVQAVAADGTVIAEQTVLADPAATTG